MAKLGAGVELEAAVRPEAVAEVGAEAEMVWALELEAVTESEVGAVRTAALGFVGCVLRSCAFRIRR